MCNAVGTRPDAVHYAKLLADAPPDTPLPASESEGVRLGVWSLLRKLGSVLLSHQLRHEDATVAPETLEKLMLDSVGDRSNSSIVSFLAGHTRAIASIAGANVQDKRTNRQRSFQNRSTPLKAVGQESLAPSGRPSGNLSPLRQTGAPDQ